MSALADLEQRALSELSACADEAGLRAWNTRYFGSHGEMPAALALGRTAIGALLLLPIAFARKQVWPVFGRWRPLLLYTAIEICVPWVLLGYAEQRLSSSLTGLLIA